MDPLSALSVAAAVVQFVEFGQRLLSETWNIYRDNSGKTLELRDLGVVSDDVIQLSTAVRDALSKKQRGAAAGGSASHEAEDILVRVCGECDVIGAEIRDVLPTMDSSFRAGIEGESTSTGWLSKKAKRSRSVGESFREALRRQWNWRKIQDMNDRLSDIRQKIMMATITSIWFHSRDAKGWAQEFSSKLDNVIAKLDGALEEMRDLGPGRSKSLEISYDGPGDSDGGHEINYRMGQWIGDGLERDENRMADPGDDEAERTFESSATESLMKTKVVEQIVHRLWSRDWEPDSGLLSSFPESTLLSARYVQSVITEGLRFESMDNREEAILRTFNTTYDWVFDRTPAVSDTGERMWSSFPTWLESDSKLPFWITGKPGSGKSTMMKHIVNDPTLREHLSQWAQGLPVYKVRYYAWKPGLDLNKSEEGLKRTLLYQVMQEDPNLVPILCPRRWALFHTTRDAGPEAFPVWTTWELDESFSHLLSPKMNSMCLLVFIDGLDEFDIAPVELCALIQRIAQHECIKICVASRPWPQFSDAFATSPLIQMHLLTHKDIESYVFGHFEGVVAFQQLNNLYRNGGQLLLSDMVSKAQGVFLWIALVTQTILQTLVEGGSLPQLQAIMEKMPLEIENLYDAIYTTIPERLLPEVSTMLRIFDAACTPLDGLTLWLADETRGSRKNMDIRRIDIDYVGASLQRRISARTRGILELVKTTQTVEYHHRAAAEWVSQPRVMDRLRSMSPPDFDPYMCLLQAEIIKTENAEENFPPSAEFWKRVTRSLFYASLVDRSIIPDKKLTEAVEEFHRVASDSVSRQEKVPSIIKLKWPMHLPSLNQDQMYFQNSFNGLAVQFAILPYVREQFRDEEDPNEVHPVTGKDSLSLLEQAVFGCERYCAPHIITGIEASKITPSQRLELVAFLLEKRARHPGLGRLIEAPEMSESCGQTSYSPQYFREVNELLRAHQSALDATRDSLKKLFKFKRGP